MPLAIESPAFAHEQAIPRRYTCDGEDRSPELRWSGAPAGTRSLALIVQDPDAPDPAAPQRVYTHWVLYDLPPTSSGLAEDVAAAALPAGTREGTNDWNRTGWGGPCPPIGRHRYYFRLHALDVLLGDIGAPTRQALERAMHGHVLEVAELMGTYERGEGRGARD
jgi:Raf kinase inhibitor-like YbhB/YbcL family protein